MGRHRFDLIVASLFFEYVAPATVLPKLARWLRPGGHLAVILQLPSPGNETVTPTPFKSLRRLAPFMELVPPYLFKHHCGQARLECTNEAEKKLPTGKMFYCGHFRMDGGAEN